MTYSHIWKIFTVYVVTTIGLSFAVCAISLVFQGEFTRSLQYALLGFVADALDGLLARRLSVVTRFGAWCDSFVDVVLYLVYPATAWVMLFGFRDFSALLVLSVFIFSGIFRLHRTASGVLQNGTHRFSFRGVPVVFSLPLLFGSFLLSNIASFPGAVYFYITLPVLSLLMISHIPFPKPRGTQLYILFFFVGVSILGLNMI